jgi:hypothetical protein
VGDETALFYRLGLGAGKVKMYVPSAEVRHQPKLDYLALGQALRRSYLGGYSAGLANGRYSNEAEPELAGMSTWRKVLDTHSWQEFCCAGIRVLGYLLGHSRACRRGE